MMVSTTQKDLSLKTICSELGDVSHKYFKIGIQLGIPFNILEKLKEERDPLAAIVNYWQRNVMEPAIPVSWNSIVAALKDNSVGETGLARKISEKYCQYEPTQENTSTLEMTVDHEAPLNRVRKGQVVQPHPFNMAMPTIWKCMVATMLAVLLTMAMLVVLARVMVPDIEMEDLNFTLEKNLKEINSEYGSYVDCLRDSIVKKGVSPKELRSYLLTLSAFSSNFKGRRLTLMSDKKHELYKANTIFEIFDFLTTECASFLNYDIFEDILKHYDIKEDRKELRYREHLKAYVKRHNISEFVKIHPLKYKDGYKEVTLKFDIEYTCSLAKVSDLKKPIAEILGVRPSALHLFDVKDGCIIVTFLIPAFVADAIFTPDLVFTSQQEDKLQAASVLWLECNGQNFFFKESHIKYSAPLIMAIVNNSDLVGKEIDSRTYKYSKGVTPSEDSQLVQEIEHLRGAINVVFVKDLGHTGEYTRVAYNGIGAAGSRFQDLQIQVQRLGFDISKLYDKSAMTIASFKSTTTTVLFELKTAYQFLLNMREYIALSTFSILDKLAEKMAKVTEDFQKEYERQEAKVTDTLEEIMLREAEASIVRAQQEKAILKAEFRAKGKSYERKEGEAGGASDDDSNAAFKKHIHLSRQAALFWNQLKEHCRGLADDRLQRRIEKFVASYSAEERSDYWLSNSFKQSMFLYISKWVTLKSVSSNYLEQIKITQQDLYEYIMEHPTYKKSRHYVEELVRDFEKDLAIAQGQIKEQKFKVEKEIEQLKTETKKTEL